MKADPGPIPLRLLMTADTVGGVWTYALDLAKALEEESVEVVLASMGAPASPDQRAEVDALSNVEFHESTYRLEWMSDPWDDISEAGEWLLGLAEWARCDLIHLNNYAHGALPWGRPVLMAAHSCVLSWWQAVKHGPAPPEWARYRASVTRGLRGAGLVAAPSQAMLQGLSEHYGPVPHSRVIPNGRDPSLFSPAPKEPFVLCAGRLWDEAKNIQALCRVAPDLSWPVYVAGDDEHPQSGPGNFSSVRNLGRLAPSALARWYARASLYVLPARYEPFGLSAVEAALSGCALVLGDIPSLREIWDGCAAFVPPDDPDSLRFTVQDLIKSPEKRLRLAEQARRKALTYGPDRMAKSYRDAYRQLLADRAAGSPLPLSPAAPAAGGGRPSRPQES